MVATGHTLTPDSASALAGAVRFGRRFSREGMNRTPTSAVAPRPTQSVEWPIQITGAAVTVDPLTGETSDTAGAVKLYPAVWLQPNSAATGFDAKDPVWFLPFPGASDPKTGAVILARLAGERAEDKRMVYTGAVGSDAADSSAPCSGSGWTTALQKHHCLRLYLVDPPESGSGPAPVTSINLTSLNGQTWTSEDPIEICGRTYTALYELEDDRLTLTGTEGGSGGPPKYRGKIDCTGCPYIQYAFRRDRLCPCEEWTGDICDRVLRVRLEHVPCYEQGEMTACCEEPLPLVVCVRFLTRHFGESLWFVDDSVVLTGNGSSGWSGPVRYSHAADGSDIHTTTLGVHCTPLGPPGFSIGAEFVPPSHSPGTAIGLGSSAEVCPGEDGFGFAADQSAYAVGEFDLFDIPGMYIFSTWTEAGCAEPAIDGWDGEGWYGVDDGAGGIALVELLEADKCDATLAILCGPYASPEAAAAAGCGPDGPDPEATCYEVGGQQLVSSGPGEWYWTDGDYEATLTRSGTLWTLVTRTIVSDATCTYTTGTAWLGTGSKVFSRVMTGEWFSCAETITVTAVDCEEEAPPEEP